MIIRPSELPLGSPQCIYHLNLTPEQIGDIIILVGDPGRVNMISEKFDSVTVKVQNRELVTHTGLYHNKKLSVISTGMGADNIDIVINELDALANIDLATGKVKADHTSLTIVRIGTCGILQPDIPLHSFIVSENALGLDGVLNYYKHFDMSDELISSAFIEQAQWNTTFPYPYSFPADTDLLNKIGHDMVHGITATAPGFFGPQGRELRAPLAFPDYIEQLASFRYNGKRIVNLEMECSAIYGLSKILGHKALTCCLGIANRVTNEFSTDYKKAMGEFIDVVLQRI